MARRTFLARLALWCPVLGVLGWLCSQPVVMWDGHWEQEEYRFTFRDRAGRPVEGVELRVENRSGSDSPHFPVADYLPGHVPASDAGGVLVFHHAPASWVSGRAWWLFGLIPMGEHSGPVYVCRFLLGGRGVHRVRYDGLVNRGGKRVKRRWKWLTWPELRGQVFRGVDWDETNSSRLRVFDLNGDGRLDREENYAATAAYAAQDRALEVMAGRQPEWEEVEFGLVERTVLLDLP